MKSKQEKETRLQLRDNRIKREYLNKQLAQFRLERQLLIDERTKLIEKAEKLGMQIGKKSQSNHIS